MHLTRMAVNQAQASPIKIIHHFFAEEMAQLFTKTNIFLANIKKCVKKVCR
jgi:hypothetical protein